MTLSVVYVLTNPAMPGLVKIGCTSQEDANTRLGQLYTTGVPVPFKLEFACKVQNPEEVERALHLAFAPDRINPRREFFQIDPDQAIAILRLLHVEEATEEVESQPSPVDEQSKSAADRMKSRRPNLNFEEMGIPIGAELRSVHTDAVATVTGNRKVRFDGEEMSLTAATRKDLALEYSVAPGPNWTYDGKSLRVIYNDTYGSNI
ncbi:GIY-YIG nuclease family protein [Paraburkholderia silviterrae]|uniref:GIY-YIG nuclease family protein n=1 Tax=Paraburkholderia silviterrae TaxID=2528715 RepID=A0A4R5ME94_9BURK|nr:GIY-YIG nuclease family protein [Paraburkholderia silviterrae]TDG25432.1 GIY-YIG nuclease family protein [Paraburkholderia silviterrae]